MNRLSFAQLMQRVERAVEGVEGWLSPREMEFLALVAAVPTAQGTVLEIGSFRGRSTVAMAVAMSPVASVAAALADPLVAVDPLRDDDPLMDAPLPQGTARCIFEANLERAGIRNRVEFHQAYSHELAAGWSRPLRVLWIDGDHHYASTKQDFDLFAPFLADGAILAMHDVLSRYDGCIRVFTEEVLPSDHFGAAGLCGSIGWAQYWKTPRRRPREERQKRELLRRLRPLVPYHCRPQPPRGLAKLRYKWLRSRVPHRAVNPSTWQQATHAA